MSFLRNLFGPSRDEIWQQFAAAVGGSFSDRRLLERRQGGCHAWPVDGHAGHLHRFHRQILHHLHPDARALCEPGRLPVQHLPAGYFQQHRKWLGMQDVTVGYPQFDEDFIIKGNDEAKLRRLFANAKIRELITAQPDINFSREGRRTKFWGGRNFPPDVDELYFQVTGVIKDVDRLKWLYDLFSETLDELCRMGSAYEKNPGVKL